MSTINVPLAEQVLRSVLWNPKEHDQGNWFMDVDFDAYSPQDGPVTSQELGKRVYQKKVVSIKGMLEGSCGSTACIAGWAALHSGWKVVTSVYEPEGGLPPRCYQSAIPPEVGVDWAVIPDTPGSIDFEVEGREALGLNEQQAGHLFYLVYEEQAIVALYGYIKGIDYYPDLIKVADLLGVPYELDVPEDLDSEYFALEHLDEDDLTLASKEETYEAVLAKIRQQYPPLTLEEWEASQKVEVA